ncbi:MAG: hypothetical protein Q9214_003460 [Letrouitia sp. 1 TL-2023]
MSYYGIPPGLDLEDRHPAVGAWFLGPRAENFHILKDIFESTLKSQEQARINLYSKDQPFITPEMQAKPLFQENIRKLAWELKALNDILKDHSVPFWSPRYQGHMNMDISFPAVIGYLVTMLYNPNNVATEASPFTTLVEKYVGQQLCRMLRYHVSDPLKKPTLSGKDVKPDAWGHITCVGPNAR